MEEEIIQIALKNLWQNIGIKGLWQKKDNQNDMLELIINGKKKKFVVDVKHEVRAHQLRHIEAHFHQHKNFMLVANRIFQKIKEELRQKEIPYLEANGNIFLKKGDIFLFVDTQKALEIEKIKGNRAFTKTGLKVVFYLLQYKEAINYTQRELAEKVGVGLGNIPQVIEGLKETGYLIPLNNKSYVWNNRVELLERWMVDYETILRPKLRKDKYSLKGQWQDLKFNKEFTVWGGEPAADILTNYLRPEKFLIFTKETRIELIKNYHLMPDKNGMIEVFEMFWKNENGKTVSPILIYADLILEGGKRNKETAEKIYHEYIQPNL